MSNEEQVEYWNGEGGKRWAEDDDTMARLLQPITEALLSHVQLQDCRRALDVGCGGGSQSLMLARQLGEGATVLGVDISAPMLEVARSKTGEGADTGAELSFLQTDASTHPFPVDGFDLVFSRFGVMFFDDPVAAFANIRSALQAGGRLVFCCWQAMKDNAWTWIPIQAALQHLPPPEPPPPNAPGPFAFADAERVSGILEDAGFREVTVTPFATTLTLSDAATLGQAVRDLARIGPVARLLADQPQPVLEQVFAAMEAVLEPHYDGSTLQLPGAVWFVTAKS